MARKRKGRPINGWLILDKPSGITSTAALNTVRRAVGAAKAGHGGTLDPLATGVLPIAFGEATKLLSHVFDGRKTYGFTIRWGVATDTEDSDGTPTETSDGRPSEQDIAGILPEFRGEIAQVPPVYSALKIDGERAHVRARRGETVSLEARQVWIEDIALAAMPDHDHAAFRVTCGKGTYMRSLARDMALRLGTCGHITALRRLGVGSFSEKDAILLDEAGKIGQDAPALPDLLPVEAALADIPALDLTEAEVARLRNGQAISMLRRADLERIAHLRDGGIALATCSKRAVAVARYEAGKIFPVRVLNL